MFIHLHVVVRVYTRMHTKIHTNVWVWACTHEYIRCMHVHAYACTREKSMKTHTHTHTHTHTNLHTHTHTHRHTYTHTWVHSIEHNLVKEFCKLIHPLVDIIPRRKIQRLAGARQPICICAGWVGGFGTIECRIFLVASTHTHTHTHTPREGERELFGNTVQVF